MEIEISMKQRCFFLLLFTAMIAFSQIEEEQIDSTAYFVRMEGDSSWIKAIALDDVYIFGKLEFSDKKEKLRYYILRRKTLKVYPYAKLAAERLVELNDSLKYFKKKRISSNKNVHKKIAEDTFFYISYYNEKRKEGHTISIERWIDGDIKSRLYARKAMWVDSTKSWKMEKVRIRDFIGT